jgi:hypothetical protein
MYIPGGPNCCKVSSMCYSSLGFAMISKPASCIGTTGNCILFIIFYLLLDCCTERSRRFRWSRAFSKNKFESSWTQRYYHWTSLLKGLIKSYLGKIVETLCLVDFLWPSVDFLPKHLSKNDRSQMQWLATRAKDTDWHIFGFDDICTYPYMLN